MGGVGEATFENVAVVVQRHLGSGGRASPEPVGESTWHDVQVDAAARHGELAGGPSCALANRGEL